MKKIFYSLIMLSIFLMPRVYAGNARITISPSSKTYIVGNSFNVEVTISSSDAIAGLSYILDYNSSVLALESTNASTGGARNLDTFMNNSTYSVTYRYKFRAKASGTSSISVSDAEVRTATSALNITKSSSTIKIMTQAELYATYSSNNYLSGLSVEGYEFEEAFDKDKLEYKVSLKPETEKIVINASKADYRASVSGVGEVEVTEGVNTIKVDVVAENGNLRSYTIIATVEEYDPINVNVDGVKYTVVRNKKAQNLNNSLFVPKDIQIASFDVPAYYNETTNTTLVILKDEKGNASSFIYDNDTYHKFMELNLSGVDLIIKDAVNISKDYKESEIKVNDISYKAYKHHDTSRYALLYGTNIKNNNTSYYLYDNLENTLQRYDDELINSKNEELKKYRLIMYILIGTSSALFILLILSLCLKKDKKKVKQKKIKQIKDIDL